MRFYLKTSAFIAICATAAFGQTSVNITPGSNGAIGTAHFGAAMPFTMGAVVTGAPYSGEQVSERVQTLADGTHITSKDAHEGLPRFRGQNAD